jgi:SAM-dependent methyltransferase
MKETLPVLNQGQIGQRDVLVERLLQSTAGVFDIFTIYIGERLGFYRVLAGSGSLTPSELASRTNTHVRYVREWLEQQTVAGILEVEDASVQALDRRFRLPAGHAEVLVERESMNYLAPLAQLAVGVTRPLGPLLDAYRNGGGVPLAQYGTDFVEGQAGINRAAFLYELGTEWLPSVPDVHARLQAGPPARIADVGCGVGWSSIGMAQAYPKVQVDGFDLDRPSIMRARANASEAGLNGRVNFQVRDAGDPTLAGSYDLVIALESIHDMSDPVRVLQSMRRLVDGTGAVIVGDERVGETFTPSGNDVEWMMYGWSVLHCLPVGLANDPSVGTGTVMRASTLRDYALEAGFRDVEVLPIDNFFFRFYRLRT